MTTKAMKWEVVDDSHGDIHGQQVFQSNNRESANSFYNEYEKIGNNVAVFQRNQKWHSSYKKQALNIGA